MKSPKDPATYKHGKLAKCGKIKHEEMNKTLAKIKAIMWLYIKT